MEFDNEALEAEEDIYVDLSAANGASTRKAMASALNCFNLFLPHWDKIRAAVEATALEPSTFENISSSYWDDHHAELFGLFASFLIVTQKYKLKTCKNYLSQLKNAILGKFKNTNIFDNEHIWYSKVRMNVQKAILQRCHEDGTSLVQSAAEMREEDLHIFAFNFIVKNTEESIFERCLLVLQWHLLGRIHELTNVHSHQLGMVCEVTTIERIGCLRIRDFCRTKGGKMQHIHIFVHHNNWEKCPIHALASMLIVNRPSEKLFAK